VKGRRVLLSPALRVSASVPDQHRKLLESGDSQNVRSVVVTGCGQGIGRAILDRLLADGYAVVGIEHNEETAEAARASAGDRADVLLGDASDRALLARARTRAMQLAPLWGWVNNAAIDTPTNLHDPVVEDVERLFAVNFFGYYWGCSEAVRALLSQGSPGAIVNISSVHARAAYSNAAAYDASKAAVEALTRYVAVEYGSVGIRANAVAPGAVRTPMAQKLLDAAEDPAQAEAEMARPHPLGRIAEPSEIAAVVTFLLSEDSSFVSGQSLAVDGGLTARCWNFDIDPSLRAHAGRRS
jgi:NAD(P)-dependent dehydrogenase (short-subunit alcohol dehydrogenase family)